MRFLFIYFSLLQCRKHGKLAILVQLMEQIHNTYLFPYVFSIFKKLKRIKAAASADEKPGIFLFRLKKSR